MELNLSFDELQDYAARYWDYAERARAEGNEELAEEFEGIARDAEAQLTTDKLVANARY